MSQASGADRLNGIANGGRLASLTGVWGSL